MITTKEEVKELLSNVKYQYSIPELKIKQDRYTLNPNENYKRVFTFGCMWWTIRKYVDDKEKVIALIAYKEHDEDFINGVLTCMFISEKITFNELLMVSDILRFEHISREEIIKILKEHR